jgi:hypothetical protein
METNQMAVKSYDELAKHVQDQGHIAVFDMGILRDLEGAGKLGKYVRSAISKSLGSHGLGHFPEDLPIYQHEEVRVFRRDSPVGRVVDAVLHPSANGDAVLRVLTDNDDHERLEQIRQILAP